MLNYYILKYYILSNAKKWESQLFSVFPVLRNNFSCKKQQKKASVLKYISSTSAKHLMAVIPANNRFKHSKTRFIHRKMMHFIWFVFATG